MRAILPFALGALLGACCQPTQSPVVSAKVPTFDVAAATAETVALVAYDKHERLFATCAGVWVGEDTILTAFHCVAPPDPDDDDDLPLAGYVVHDDVKNAAGFDRSAQAVPRPVLLFDVDTEHDLALLRTAQTPNHPVARLATESGFVGEATFTIGHPFGLWFSYAQGQVSNLRRLKLPGASGNFFQTTLPINQGNSGGGLFNDAGEVLGVCHAKWEGEGLNLFIHSSHLVAFVRPVVPPSAPRSP